MSHITESNPPSNSSLHYYFERSNEKELLVRAVHKELSAIKINSLLDIRSGNGRANIDISLDVPNYIAVHPDPANAAYIRSCGKEVIEDEFPTKIPGAPFDAVLAYHSLSFNKEKQESFISEALSAVKPDGSFLLVTYRWGKDHWSRILKKIDKEELISQENNLHNILYYLHKAGRVSIHEIRTSLHTMSAKEMFQALSFVYSDGRFDKVEFFQNHHKELIDILKKYHRSPTGFSFVFKHILVHTKKKLK